MKRKLFLFPVLAVGFLLASCKDDGGTLNETPNLILNPKGTQTVTLEATAETYAYDVKISRSMGKDKALTIQLAVDQTKLPSGKTLLKTDYYSFNKTVTMDANVGQATFTVTFKPSEMFENETEESWGIYSLPIKISSVTPEITLNADDTYVVINTSLRGASIISEGTTEYAEVFTGGDDATVKLTATANYSADAAKVTYSVDAAGVAAFNTENGTSLTLLPSSGYTIAAGVWDVEDVYDDEGDIIDEIDVIANTITIKSSLAKGQYVLPLKVATTEDGINIDQQEPVYILVESFAAATAATVMNGDFESPLPLGFAIEKWYYPEDAMAAAAGVWRWKPEWWSSAGGTDEQGNPTHDAEFKMSIYPNGVSGNCFVMECSPGTFDNIVVQKITGLNPAKMYTLSAKAKVSDITTTAKTGGARIGCWKKDNTEYWGSNANWSEKTVSEGWTDLSLTIASINADGTALIALRFGGSSADTDGKAYFDDVKIAEFTPAVVGQLANGDFENQIGLSYTSLGTSAAAVTSTLNGIVPQEWTCYNGWNLAYAISGNGGLSHASEGRSNSKCVKVACRTDVDTGMDFAILQKIVDLTPGDKYTLSAWIKGEGLTKAAANRRGGRCVWYKPTNDAGTEFPLQVDEADGLSSPLVLNADWTKVSLEVTVPPAGAVIVGVRLGGNSGDVDGTWWIDDITFVKQ